MDFSGVPLAEIRARLTADQPTASMSRAARALRRDPRRGARTLADALERRIRARRAERRRLAALFARRRRLRAAGARLVAGVDEVGVGPLAGPVVAAAVVLPERVDLPGLDDSKRLARGARERLAEGIRAQALAVAVAEVPPDEIDRTDVRRASLEAMRRAVCALGVRPDHVLVDARTIPRIPMAQTALIHGDAIDGSIAAASIVAKVHRDEMMRRFDRRHPGYHFGEHKGYATRRHLAALRRLGPSPIHRRSFAPVAQLELL
jgi:ribonuclease HII